MNVTETVINSTESNTLINAIFTTEDSCNYSGRKPINEDITNASCFSGPCSTSWVTLTTVAVLPILLFVGVFGNAFTIIVMRSKKFRSSPTGVFLTALALSDLTFILTFPFAKSATRVLLKEDIRAFSDVGCKLYFWVFRGTKWCSAWIVALIGCERFLVVWFPLKAKLISNKRISLIAVTNVVIIGFAYETFRTFNTYIVNGVCTPNNDPPELKTSATIFMIISTIVYTVTPKVILLCATPLTIAKLLQQRKTRQGMTHNTGTDETKHITIMLLCVTTTYIILVTPISVAHLVTYFQGDNIFLIKEVGFVIFREIAQILEMLNFVINFFLYVISSASFRRQFFEIIQCTSERTTNMEHNPVLARTTSSSNIE